MPRRAHHLTERFAFVLSAKLRAAGVYVTGSDLMLWNSNSVRSAKLWLTLRAERMTHLSFAEFMAEDLPPSSPRSWS